MGQIFPLLLIVTKAFCTSTAASDEIKTKVIHVGSRDLKSPEGLYVYKYDGKGATEVCVSIDEISIACLGKDSKPKMNESLVQQMNFTHISLFKPSSITISVVKEDDFGGKFTTEKRLSYIVQKDEPTTSAPPATTALHEIPPNVPPWGIGLIVTLAAVAALFVPACIWYRKNGKNGPCLSIFQKSVNNKLQGDSNTDRARGQGQNAKNHSLLTPDVNICMSNCGQGEEDQAGKTREPEDHNELNPFIHPDSRNGRYPPVFPNSVNNKLEGGFNADRARDPGQDANNQNDVYINMPEREPGQDREEGECKPAEKGNAEQTGAGMLEHGDCTTRDVVSGDAVEAHSPQDDPLVALNKEERHSEYSHSCGVTKTSGKGKRDNTKNSGGTERTQEEQPNNVEFVGTTTNEERIV